MPIKPPNLDGNKIITGPSDLLREFDTEGKLGSWTGLGGWIFAMYELENCPNVTRKSVWRDCNKPRGEKIKYPFRIWEIKHFLRVERYARTGK